LLSLCSLPGNIFLVQFSILYSHYCFESCTVRNKIPFPQRNSHTTGSVFYKIAAAFNWRERDSLVLQEVFAGNLPSFLKRFVPVKISLTDSLTGKLHKATFYVAPDYLSIGTNEDWARVNITPMAAQRVADRLNCFFPTRKLVDEVYKAAKVKLEPVPMYAFRDSTPTMWQHHLVIEGQRKMRKGLIAGIMKDVVITARINNDPKPGRVAIYGWHKPDGHPIQPLYSGHVNWYVDYSHGIRLIYRKIKIDHKWMDYIDVLKDPVLSPLISDEGDTGFYKYPY
jgi:hypothetical protein